MVVCLRCSSGLTLDVLVRVSRPLFLPPKRLSEWIVIFNFSSFPLRVFISFVGVVPHPFLLQSALASYRPSSPLYPSLLPCHKVCVFGRLVSTCVYRGILSLPRSPDLINPFSFLFKQKEAQLAPPTQK